MKITISLDQKKFKAKPEPIDAGLISTSIGSNQKGLSFEEFVDILNNGQTWCPGTFKDGRKAIKWTGQSAFVADLDDKNYSLYTIMEMAKDFDLPMAIVHSTFSSQPDNQKWRIVYISDKVITDGPSALAILRKIQQFWNSDKCTIDLARLLYSSNNGVAYSKEVYFKSDDIEYDKYLSSNSGQPMANTMAKDLPEESKVKNKKYKFLQSACIRDISKNPGARYQILWSNVRKLSQSGLFSEADIKKTVEYGIYKSGGRYDNYDKDIYEIVATAMAWGSAHSWPNGNELDTV